MDTHEQNRTGSNLQPETTDMPQEGQTAQDAAARRQAQTSAAPRSPPTISGAPMASSQRQFHASERARQFPRLHQHQRIRREPQERFIGAARMAVYNIAPYDGGFRAWVDISWNSPLNIRFDVLIDP